MNDTPPAARKPTRRGSAGGRRGRERAATSNTVPADVGLIEEKPEEQVEGSPATDKDEDAETDDGTFLALSALLPPLPDGAKTLPVKPTDTAVTARLLKTKMCYFFERGKCANKNCRYAHSRDELRHQPNLQKTKLCKIWVQSGGHCSDGENCIFAHGEAELRVTDGIYKTQMCHFFERGRCLKGDRCNHAHGFNDLRIQAPTVSPAKSEFQPPPKGPAGFTPNCVASYHTAPNKPGPVSSGGSSSSSSATVPAGPPAGQEPAPRPPLSPLPLAELLLGPGSNIKPQGPQTPTSKRAEKEPDSGLSAPKTGLRSPSIPGYCATPLSASPMWARPWGANLYSQRSPSPQVRHYEDPPLTASPAQDMNSQYSVPGGAYGAFRAPPPVDCSVDWIGAQNHCPVPVSQMGGYGYLPFSENYEEIAPLDLSSRLANLDVAVAAFSEDCRRRKTVAI